MKEYKEYLVVKTFSIEGQVEQPMYDDNPGLASFTVERFFTFFEGEIMELDDKFIPISGQTDRTVSLFGGTVTFYDAVPKGSVRLVVNKEILGPYMKEKLLLDDIEEELREEQYYASLTNEWLEAEEIDTMEESLSALKSYFKFQNSCFSLENKLEKQNARVRLLKKQLLNITNKFLESSSL